MTALPMPHICICGNVPSRTMHAYICVGDKFILSRDWFANIKKLRSLKIRQLAVRMLCLIQGPF